MPEPMPEKQNDKLVDTLVQQVQQGHLSEALKEVNSFYKNHNSDSSERFTSQFFSKINQKQLCPLVAAGVFSKGSDILASTDLHNDGLDDGELKTALSKKLSPIERMTASYMLLNSEKLAGSNGRITSDSLQDAAKKMTIPALEIVATNAPGKLPAAKDKQRGEANDKQPEVQKPVIIPREAQERSKPAQMNLSEAREELFTEARQRGMELSKLNGFARALEQRCAEGRQEGLKAPTDKQLAETYQALVEMLRGPGQDSGLHDRDREYLVGLSLRNLAFPNKIDQGMDMCPVGTLEILTASHNPQSYARLMKEVSLTGGFTTTGGKHITLPPESIKPGLEQFAFNTENVGQNRWQNWASKIFQETAANSVVPFLPADDNFPARGKPHISGKTDMMLDQIQMASQAIAGMKVPYLENGHAPSAQELLKMRQQGDFPAGIHTIHVADSTGAVWGLHVQTLQDFRIQNGQPEVYLDNQRGGVQDVGWISLPELYRWQQLSVPASNYYLPTGSRIR